MSKKVWTFTKSSRCLWVNTELSKVITMKCCQEHATKKKSESLMGIKPMTWAQIPVQGCSKHWATERLLTGFSVSLFFNYYFFPFPFSPFLIFLLQRLTFYWAFLQFRNSRERITDRDGKFSSRSSQVVEGNFPPSFSLKFVSIFVHISSLIDPITLIWDGYHWKIFSCRTRL